MSGACRANDDPSTREAKPPRAWNCTRTQGVGVVMAGADLDSDIRDMPCGGALRQSMRCRNGKVGWSGDVCRVNGTTKRQGQGGTEVSKDHDQLCGYT